MFHQNYLALGLATWRAARVEGSLHRRYPLPAERGKQADGRLFNEQVFGAGVVSHAVWSRRYAQKGTYSANFLDLLSGSAGLIKRLSTAS